MNPPHRTGAALDSRRHCSTQSYSSHLLTDYAQSRATSRLTTTNAVTVCVRHSASFSTSFLSSWSLTFVFSFWNVSPFVACRPASPLTSGTATYRYNKGREFKPLMEMRRARRLVNPDDLQDLNADSNWRSQLLNSSAHSKVLNTANFYVI